jgi:hypothetical protein
MSAKIALRPEFVLFVPQRPGEGVLYISRRYRTASHLCCCGCGLQVVTPLNPAKWQLTEHPDGSVSLSPSVGNSGCPTKSHYWVIRNGIQWAPAMTPGLIAAAQARDQAAVEQLVRASRSRFRAFADAVAEAWSAFTASVKKWIR